MGSSEEEPQRAVYRAGARESGLVAQCPYWGLNLGTVSRPQYLDPKCACREVSRLTRQLPTVPAVVRGG